MLNIMFEFRKGVLFVRMGGVINKTTYTKYFEVINMIVKNGIRTVVLNLENINEIDLKGINSLFYTYEVVRNNKGRLLLSNINKNINKNIVKSHILNYVNVVDNEIEVFNLVVV